MPPRFWPWVASLSLFLLLVPAVAHADWPRGGDDRMEELFADGEVDPEDLAVLHFGGGSAAADVHGQSWVSIMGFTRQLLSGGSDGGAMVVVGLALDRVALGPVHRLADPGAPAQPGPTLPPARTSSPPPPPSPPDPPPPSHRTLVSPALSRACVAAALRASGLGVDDTRIDALVTRARESAWLPETRMRAMRLLVDATHATTLATTDGTNYYDAVGANLVLELRLTWRLDRLVYAGDEPTLERTRMERQEARSRLATRTLEVLFAWQRAVVDAESSQAGSREELDAWLHASEAQATLDVLTDGWFSSRGE
jgi:hypothetical protein